jgi:hypothetical protein
VRQKVTKYTIFQQCQHDLLILLYARRITDEG